MAQSGNRKTLTSADVLAALKELELDSFSTPLKEAIDGDHIYTMHMPALFLL